VRDLAATVIVQHCNRKEFVMHQTNPNRTRNQTGERLKGQHKKSGDQHLVPEDELPQEPSHPHRLNRDDMQKIELPDTDSDEPGTR
jgi:hypothetical protein